jgi:hypothetical protein
MSAAQLLPAVRDLYSRVSETYHLEPWELQHVLFSLGYTDDLADEGEIAGLRATLSELASLDRPQCRELRMGSREAPSEPLSWTVEAWLRARLREWVGVPPRHGGFKGKVLADLDPLATAPNQD